MEKKRAYNIILLDLSAAFDIMDYEHLLECLQSRFGIRGNALSLFRSHLADHSQWVIIGIPYHH